MCVCVCVRACLLACVRACLHVFMHACILLLGWRSCDEAAREPAQPGSLHSQDARDDIRQVV